MVKIDIFRKIRPKFTIEGFRILSTDFDHVLGKRPQGETIQVRILIKEMRYNSFLI